MCVSSAAAVAALAREGCQYQMREPLFYLQDECVACDRLEDLLYILRLPQLREENCLRTERDLVLLVRGLQWALRFPPCPRAAPSSLLTSSSDDTLMAATSSTLATDCSRGTACGPRFREGRLEPSWILVQRASSWSEKTFDLECDVLARTILDR